MKKNLSLYVHIPFCIKKCAYCDFLSFTCNQEEIKSYIKSLKKEIKGYSYLRAEYQIISIFIGGGTPSIIEEKYIKELLEEIQNSFTINEGAEITIEANPNSISTSKLKAYLSSGINRLSIGLQSTNDAQLKILGRAHTFSDFKENFYLARCKGFNNINIDIMSALPGQTVEEYSNTLNTVLEFSPEHISAYSLIIEENTKFYNNPEIINILPNEEEDREMYNLTKELLEKQAYKRYEISNYGKEGYECKHNLVYWQGGEYLGLGLGASSYINNSRFKNEEKLNIYIENGNKNLFPKKEIINLSTKNKMEEFMFLGLRVITGIDCKKFQKEFGNSIENVYGNIINKYISTGFLIKENNNLRLTLKGLDVSNIILSQFLLD